VASGGYKVSSDECRVATGQWLETLLELLEFIEFFEFIELLVFIGFIGFLFRIPHLDSACCLLLSAYCPFPPFPYLSLSSSGPSTSPRSSTGF